MLLARSASFELDRCWKRFIAYLAVARASALELLFSGNGFSSTFRNSWPGWYNAGGYVMDSDGALLSGYDGKRQAYDTTELVGLRFEDKSGAHAEYALLPQYCNRSLLQIVSSCMGSDLRNDGSAAWRRGHCPDVGHLVGSFGIPAVADHLSIGLAGETQQSLDWVLFPLQNSSRRPEQSYAFGTPSRTNPGFVNRVYIYGVQHVRQSAGMWKSVSRPCRLDADFCVVSPNFPKYYGGQEVCRIEIDDSKTRPLDVRAFHTERLNDVLTVNGQDFSGDVGPDGVIPTGIIFWRADHFVSKSGWRLCPSKPGIQAPRADDNQVEHQAAQITGLSACLPPDVSGADDGYRDQFRGWYDVQGCGKCNDYCRWVGNSGPGGDPSKRLSLGTSWWSCRLAGSSKAYSAKGSFQSWSREKCTGEGADAPQVAADQAVFLPALLLGLCCVVLYFGPAWRRGWRRWFLFHRSVVVDDIDKDDLCDKGEAEVQRGDQELLMERTAPSNDPIVSSTQDACLE